MWNYFAMPLNKRMPVIALGVLPAVCTAIALVWPLMRSDVTKLTIVDGEVIAVSKLAGSDVQKVCFFPSYGWGKAMDCTGDRWVNNPDVPNNMLYFTVVSNGICSNYSTAAKFGFGLNDVKFCSEGDQANKLEIGRKGDVVFLQSP